MAAPAAAPLAPASPVARAPRLALHLGAAVGLGLVLHLVAAALTDLTPDEAYYALWSRHLAWDYFDHPPAVAFAIAAGRALFGEGALAVRAPALLAAAGVPILLALAASRLAGPRAGAWAAWLASATLLVHVLGVVVTPDTPLTLAWAAALLLAADLLARAREGAPGTDLGRLALLGAAAGAAILSKLTGAALLAGVVAAFLAVPEARRRLGPRLALVPLTAGLVASPWLLAVLGAPERSDAAFQLSRLRPSGAPLIHLVELLAGQAAVLGPVVFAGALVWMRRALRRRAPEDRLLLALSLPTLLAFLGLAFLRRVEVNWPAPGWLAAVVGLAILFAEAPRPRLGRALVATAAPVVVLVHVLAVTGLPRGLADPTARLRGWQALGTRLEARCAELAPTGGARLAAVGYGLASEVAFYAPACAPLRPVPDGRSSQLERWPVPPWPSAGRVLYLHTVGGPPPAAACFLTDVETIPAGGRLRDLQTLDCGPGPLYPPPGPG